MTDLVGYAFVAGGVVASFVHGWRAQASSKEARAATSKLGDNLGPRVQQLQERVAFLEGKLGVHRSGILEGGDDGQHHG